MSTIRHKLLEKQLERVVYDDGHKYDPNEPIDEPVKTSKESIEDVIFYLDPVTRLPASDIAQLLSGKCDSSLAQYIQSQFLRLNEPSGGVSDEQSDELFAYMRLPDESREQYLSRVTKMFDDAEADKRRYSAELNNQNVPGNDK